MAKNRAARVKTGGGGKLGAFFLGLLMGIIFIVGALAGVGFFVYKQPIKKTVNLIDSSGGLYDKLFNAESGYLNEKYASATVGELLKDGLAAVASLSSGGSLAGLDNITPKTGKTVDKVLATTDKYGIPIEKETLMSKPIGEISPYIEGQIKETPLGGLLEGVNGQPVSDSMLLTICYGPASHYTLGEDGKVTMNQIVYTLEDVILEDETPGKALFDIDGDNLSEEGTLDLSAKTFTLTTGEVHYLQLDPSITTKETYKAYTDAAFSTPALYPKTKAKDFAGSNKIFDDLTLADTLNVKNVNSSHSVLVELAYGKKDENYTVEEDGTIVVMEGSRPRTIGDLKESNKDLINDITLANALNVNGNSHTVLLSLAYGKKGVNYEVVEDAEGNKTLNVLTPDSARTLGDLSNNGTDLINDVALSDILPEDRDSSLIMYMLYGREGVHYVIDEMTNEIEMLQKRIAVYYDSVQNTYTPYNEYGELIEAFDKDNSDLANGVYVDANGVTYFFDPTDTTTLGTIKTKLANGKSDGTKNMAQLFYLSVEEEGVRVPVKYEASTLGSISGKNNAISTMTTRLTVSEVFDKTTVQGNMFLKHVPNETIDSLPAAILNLSVTQVYEKDVYKYDETKGGFLDKNGVALADQTDVSARIVNAEWWYLLHNSAECTPGSGGHVVCGMTEFDPATPYVYTADSIHHYTVSDMGALVTNMTKNMENATLYRLHMDKMLDLGDTDLSKTVNFTVIENSALPDEEKTTILNDLKNNAKIENGQKIGNLTVLQAVKYLTAILEVV